MFRPTFGKKLGWEVDARFDACRFKRLRGLGTVVDKDRGRYWVNLDWRPCGEAGHNVP